MKRSLNISRLIKQSVDYIPVKRQDDFLSNLKMIYLSNNINEARIGLHFLQKNWKCHYRAVRVWERQWFKIEEYFRNRRTLNFEV
ncbi:MAG: transposase [Lachnospiraceae bacterium]|nr:transposase [Lachnospiraceae bacterium]